MPGCADVSLVCLLLVWVTDLWTDCLFNNVPNSRASNIWLYFVCLFFSISPALVLTFKWSTVDGAPGPAGPAADRIANTTDDVRAPVHRLPTAANIASAVTSRQLIAPVECVEVSNHNSRRPVCRYLGDGLLISSLFPFVSSVFSVVYLFSYYNVCPWRYIKKP